MKLGAWLEADGRNIAEFAEAIGVQPQSVHRYLDGERIPVPKVMTMIVAVTEGLVTANDFYGAPTDETRPAEPEPTR